MHKYAECSFCLCCCLDLCCSLTGALFKAPFEVCRCFWLLFMCDVIWSSEKLLRKKLTVLN